MVAKRFITSFDRHSRQYVHLNKSTNSELLELQKMLDISDESFAAMNEYRQTIHVTITKILDRRIDNLRASLQRM